MMIIMLSTLDAILLLMLVACIPAMTSKKGRIVLGIITGAIALNLIGWIAQLGR